MHTLSHEQYYSKHHFLDICRCAFKDILSPFHNGLIKVKIRKLPCIPGIVYWKYFFYIGRITGTYVHQKAFLLSRNREVCITIALHIHFPLPSLSLLHKICSSTTDTVKCAHTLRNEGKITNDVCLMFGNLKSILLVIWWFIIVQESYAKDWCRWVMQRIDLVYGSWLEKFYYIP